MRIGSVLLLLACILGLASARAAAQPADNNCWDPSIDYGAGNKVFYEGWGYGPPAGDYSGGGAPYQVKDYGRGWTSIGPNPLAWVISGKNGQNVFLPKPPGYDPTERMRENDDYTNSGAYAHSSSATGGSWPYADEPFSSGVYNDGHQTHHMQCVWFDINGNVDLGVGDGSTRLQVLLRHPIPALEDGKKVRADVQYYWTKNYHANMGYGIRIYFEKIAGGEGWIDFAPHTYDEVTPLASKFAYRIMGIAEHPEWEAWSDTYLPIGAGNFAAPEDRVHWRHVGIDFGLITEGEITLVTREASYTEQENRFAHLTGINLFDYIVGATAIAVGQVDEAPTGPVGVPSKNFMDNVWISTSLPPTNSIGGAKGAPDGAEVDLAGAIVTSRFWGDFPYPGSPGAFAIQAADRAVGMRVVWGSDLNAGDEVSVQGRVDTIDGEHVIVADAVSVSSSGHALPDPLVMNNRVSGGGELGMQGAVVNDANVPSYATGLNTVGLLASIFGKVTAAVPTDGTFGPVFYVDDGSGLQDGTGNIGIRCRLGSTFGLPEDPPEVGRYVTVHGVMGVTLVNQLNTRLFWTTSWEYED